MDREETQEELEARYKRMDELIKNINEHTRKIKEIDRKIAEKRSIINKTNKININDVGLLPLIW